MKHLSENRTIAWAVFVVCVLFSLSFSSQRALTNLRADNEVVFFKGTTESMGLSIDKHLSTRSTSAYNIASVAANYPEVDQTLVREVQQTADQLGAAKTIADKNTTNIACDRAVESLYSVIDNMSLSKNDETYAYAQYKEFKGAADLIRHDKYNDYALDFNQELSNFPASLLARLTGVQPLPRFS